MGVHGRDLGHVADDVGAVVAQFGVRTGSGAWTPYDPNDLAKGKKTPMEGSNIQLSARVFPHAGYFLQSRLRA